MKRDYERMFDNAQNIPFSSSISDQILAKNLIFRQCFHGVELIGAFLLHNVHFTERPLP